MSKALVLGLLRQRLEEERDEWIEDDLDDPGSLAGFENMARLSVAIELLENYEWEGEEDGEG